MGKVKVPSKSQIDKYLRYNLGCQIGDLDKLKDNIEKSIARRALTHIIVDFYTVDAQLTLKGIELTSNFLFDMDIGTCTDECISFQRCIPFQEVFADFGEQVRDEAGPHRLTGLRKRLQKLIRDIDEELAAQKIER